MSTYGNSLGMVAFDRKIGFLAGRLMLVYIPLSKIPSVMYFIRVLSLVQSSNLIEYPTSSPSSHSISSIKKIIINYLIIWL